MRGVAVDLAALAALGLHQRAGRGPPGTVTPSGDGVRCSPGRREGCPAALDRAGVDAAGADQLVAGGPATARAGGIDVASPRPRSATARRPRRRTGQPSAARSRSRRPSRGARHVVGAEPTGDTVQGGSADVHGEVLGAAGAALPASNDVATPAREQLCCDAGRTHPASGLVPSRPGSGRSARVPPRRRSSTSDTCSRAPVGTHRSPALDVM